MSVAEILREYGIATTATKPPRAIVAAQTLVPSHATTATTATGEKYKAATEPAESAPTPGTDPEKVRTDLRAQAVARRAEIWAAMHPEESEVEQIVPLQSEKAFKGQLGGARPHSKAFAAETAQVSGQDKREVNRHLARGRALGDDLHAIDTRTDLLALADRLAVDRDHVHRLDNDGLALLAAIGEGGMRAFLLAADDAATRQAGKVPLDDTAAIYCTHCGPVFVHPAIAKVLPVVAGWPRAAGCPWCAIRKAGGYVPRPRVACETCTSFKPDTVNPAAGMGTCASGHGMHYAMQPHPCDGYRLTTEGTDHD